jgi:putative transposase
MPRKKYSDELIARALHAAEVCRKYGVTDQTFYRWKRKFGAMTPSEIKRLKILEEENRRLKQIVAELTLDKQMLQDVIRKKD